jgi:flagellar basal-body rod modification protein FlgD
MSTVQDVANPWQRAISSAATPAPGMMQEAQDRFLKLLVSQMKNQDPLNPMDNAQVTSQMAQISTVAGIEKLNATLSALGDDLATTQSLAAAELVGRGVLVPGATLALSGGQAPFGIELRQSAERVSVTIQDDAARTLQRVELGPQPAGTLSLTWDGLTETGERAPDGNYRIVVDAKSGSTAVDAVPLRHTRVNGVTPGAQGLTLELDRVGPVQLGDLKHIY